MTASLPQSHPAARRSHRPGFANYDGGAVGRRRFARAAPLPVNLFEGPDPAAAASPEPAELVTGS